MSITDRSWTTEELRRVAEDDRLATLLLNKERLSNEEWRVYYTLKARKFQVWVKDQEEITVVKAINEESLGWFLKQEYHQLELEQIVEVTEVITSYVDIPLEKLKLGGV